METEDIAGITGLSIIIACCAFAVVSLLYVWFSEAKHAKKRRAKCNTVIAAREVVAQTTDGIVLQQQDGSGYWAIMPREDWMKLRNYDDSSRMDKKERAVEREKRKIVAKTTPGVLVQDRSGYWGIVPYNNWISMRKYDADWLLIRKYDKLFNEGGSYV